MTVECPRKFCDKQMELKTSSQGYAYYECPCGKTLNKAEGDNLLDKQEA